MSFDDLMSQWEKLKKDNPNDDAALAKAASVMSMSAPEIGLPRLDDQYNNLESQYRAMENADRSVPDTHGIIPRGTPLDTILHPVENIVPSASPLVDFPESKSIDPLDDSDVEPLPIKSIRGFDKQVVAGKKDNTSDEPTSSTPPASTEDDEMKQALEDRRKNMMLLGILQGSSDIGRAIAGQNRDADYTKQLGEMAQMPVQDIKTARAALKEKLELDTQKELSDPNSNASQMQRKAMRDMLNKIGYGSLAGKINDNMSAMQVQKVMGNLNIQNLMQQHEALEARKEMMAMRNAQLAEAAKLKLDDKDTRRLDQANKTIQASLARNNTAFGRGANIVRSAEAIENLVAGMNTKDIDQRQIYEIASSLDAMLTSGASTVSGREHLIPKSFSKDKSAIEEYIMGRPRGAGQEEFVKRLLETVHREKALAKQQLQRESGKMLSSYGDLQHKNPDAWNLMMDMNQLPRDIFSQPSPNVGAGQGDKVKVKLPDGKVGLVPKAKLNEYKKHGAVEVP